MKKEKEIYELIVAYLREVISEEEKMELQEWMDKHESHKRLFAELCDKERMKEEIGQYASFDTEGRWKQFEKNLEQERKRSRRGVIWKISAASVAVLLAVGIGLLSYPSKKESVKRNAEVMAIVPGETQAVLILGDGREVVLKGMRDTTLLTGSGEQIRVDEKGELQYALSEKSNIPEMHTLRIPRGGEYKITLDDSTRIWLNSETQFTYPVHFTGKERKVKVTGEAYFKVTENKERPFIVETDKMNIRVLGTSFNVTTYSDEEESNTTLVEGRVEVSLPGSTEKIVLKPGEQVLIRKEKAEVRKVNTKLYTSWMRERFSFESEDMEAVIRKLSRWYDVSFFFTNPEMKQKRFTGSIPKYEEIHRVLKMMEMTTSIRFSVKDKTIIVR